MFVFKPKISTDDRNEVFKVGTRLFLASLIYYIIKSFKGGVISSNIFFGFIISCLTYIFYKIFVNGIVVIRDVKNINAFTVEEIISASLIFSIAVSVFSKITIFNYSITNIIIIALMLIIGYKNGVMVGVISGVSIGLALNLISDLDSFQILVFVIAGIVSGLIGFIIRPSDFKTKIKEEILLGNNGENRLNYYEEIKEKINAVAQTITDMNNNFFIKNTEDTDNLNREVYIDNFLNLMDSYQENIFYEDLVNNENLIEDFFNVLVKDDVITEKEMLEVFRKYNNYILLRDQKLKEDFQEIIKISNRTYRELQMNSVKVKIKKEEAKKLENELKNVSKIITNISKDEPKGEYQNKEKEIITLLKGKMYPIKNVKVSKIKNGKYIVEISLKDSIRDRDKITNIENLISRSLGVKISFQKEKRNLENTEYTQVYSTEDRFALQVGSSKISKNGKGEVSGDSSLAMRLNDGKYLLSISDGMGSGEKAKSASKFVINSLNTLLSKGFEREETLRLINSELNFNKDSEMYATVDISVLDLYTGNILISKNGGCNTYIKSKKSVKIYKGNSLPIGIVEDAGLETTEDVLNEGDIILMCSDGLLDSNSEAKKDWIEEFLKNVNTNNVQKIADIITSEAIDNSYGVPKDDITVIVAKIIKKK